MIKSVTVTNFKNESLTMILNRPEDSGLIVEKIDGLGPPHASIGGTELPTKDGSLFTYARCEQRNIVMTLRMMFAPTVEHSRQKTYRYFPVKKPVTIEVETDLRTLQATGYVESNEPDIFSPEESAQISIVCPDPYFYDKDETRVVFSGVEPLFEFPFENTSLSEPTLEMSRILIDTRTTIIYHGDADTGMELNAHMLRPVRGLKFYGVDNHQLVSFDDDKLERITGSKLKFGDDIIITTFKGSKRIELYRDGVRTNILAAANYDVGWFELTPGANTFAYSADEGERDVIVTILYRNAYGGV